MGISQSDVSGVQIVMISHFLALFKACKYASHRVNQTRRIFQDTKKDVERLGDHETPIYRYSSHSHPKKHHDALWA